MTCVLVNGKSKYVSFSKVKIKKNKLTLSMVVNGHSWIDFQCKIKWKHKHLWQWNFVWSNLMYIYIYVVGLWFLHFLKNLFVCNHNLRQIGLICLILVTILKSYLTRFKMKLTLFTYLSYFSTWTPLGCTPSFSTQSQST